MGDCHTLNTSCRIIIMIQKGTIILTTTRIAAWSHCEAFLHLRSAVDLADDLQQRCGLPRGLLKRNVQQNLF